MSVTDDLSTLFPIGGEGMQLRQGTIIDWDADTGENTVRVGGAALANLPVLVAESVILAPGDVVALLVAGDRMFIMGQIRTPGDAGTVPTWSADITTLSADVATAQTTADTAQTAATTAAADAATALAKFPITETDISDGAISTPKLSADAIDGMTITGAVLRTAAAGQRVEIDSPIAANEIRFYTADASEIAPGTIQATTAEVTLTSPSLGGGQSFVEIRGTETDNQVLITAGDGIILRGDDSASVNQFWAMPSGVVMSAENAAHEVIASAAGVELGIYDGSPGVITVQGGTGGIDIAATGGGTVRVNSAAKFGGGTSLSGLRFATTNATTNASGQVVVTHGHAVTPTAILLGNSSHYVRVQASSTTTFTVECRSPSTNALAASTSVTFYWAALVT
ncbi:MAG TPA: hypothetical protein VIQ30_25485 [Pseudonocardia sp.]